MKIEQTLRQVCTELGVSRRTVQGYEKAGLVAPSGKNKYGHLLYGEPERKTYPAHPVLSAAGLFA